MGNRVIVLIGFIIVISGCSAGAKHGQYQEGMLTLPAKVQHYTKIRIRLDGEEKIQKQENYPRVKEYFERKLTQYIKTKTNFKDVALLSAKDQGLDSLIISVKILDYRYRDASHKIGALLVGGVIGLTAIGKSEFRIYVLYLDGNSKQKISKLVLSQRKGTTHSAIRKLSTKIALGLNATGKSVQKFSDNSKQYE